ncbi:MAG: G5 domain-containing protein [Oscillospiraceae bacterium]
MSNKGRRALRDVISGRGRLAIWALLLATALTVVGVTVYRGRHSDASPPKAMTLEEMERSGQIVLAYDHDEDDLGTMLDLQAARYFTVTVVADGQEHEVRVTRTDTVDEILKRAKVTLGPEDDMSHFPGRTVNPGERIVVERWTRDTVTEENVVPFETVEIASSLLAPGKKRVVLQGADGLALQTYQRVLRDGVVVEKTLTEETVLQPSVSQRVLVGTDCAPISPYDFEWELDENGVPVDCEAVLEKQRAAGYSARPGAGTACGYLKAAVGHVAVNPNVIPYGSKLYIRSTDGRFVYGYAIAADTGTALMQGIVDLDLFYQTYAESCLNGIRQVDVYVLEYPKKK